MLRSLSLAALVAAPLALWSFAAPSAPPAQSAAACNLWMHEPLVAFDVTGTTLSGPVDECLYVYSDGTIKRFSMSQGLAQVAYTTPAEASAFARDLFLAGAFSACDQPQAGSDVPLRTLTLFRGVQSPQTHTVNWWFAEGGPYGTFQNMVNAFVATHIP